MLVTATGGVSGGVEVGEGVAVGDKLGTGGKVGEGVMEVGEGLGGVTGMVGVGLGGVTGVTGISARDLDRVCCSEAQKRSGKTKTIPRREIRVRR